MGMVERQRGRARRERGGERRRTRQVPSSPHLCVLCVLCSSAAIGCGSHPRNLLIVHFDGGADAALEDAAIEDAPALPDPTLGGPCVDDAQCDDHIACTFDSCDAALRRCRNVPDDTQCDDGIYCDGKERCALLHGCQPGPVVTCSDGKACDIAMCVEATKSCAYTARDVDQDGDPDANCVPNRDCDDLDPNVSSLHAEVCANHIDDNCNGLIDEQPCVPAPGDTCANAIAITGAGTYMLSTLGAGNSFAASCAVSKPQGASSVVAAITVRPGLTVDLEAWATSSTEVAIALDGACGQPTSELACGSGPGATSVRARARNVNPGTYYAIVTTQSETSGIGLSVDLLLPTGDAGNVDCATATPIAPNAPTTVQIINPPTRLASACPASTGELTYALTLSKAQDVRVYASTLRGSGSPIVGLRSPHCIDAADELRCSAAGAPPVFARAIGPGTYVLTVAASSPIDASVEVSLSPPTATPADQTCGAPPGIAANARLGFDLSSHEGAIADGCLPGRPDAAYDLSLPSATDVLLIDRFPQTETGAVSLDTAPCTAADRLACDHEATGPARVAKRNVPAGDYRVVVADDLGLQGTVDALVRPTVAPTILPPAAADTCAQAVDASGGGFFTGDTSSAHADYSNGCDAPTSPPGGAPDQVLSLTLTQPQRVVLDMEGSSYSTILDIRQGPACPGAPIDKGCYVGVSGQRSFVDLELMAGQYWIIVDGYQQAKGPWDLDVRVLSP
jgi:hypothetical protein